MNNSVFGKTMENVRDRVKTKYVKFEKDLKKAVSQPNFNGLKVYSKNLIACHMKRQVATFDKPIYFEMSILDLSKILIYEFHYETIKKKYRDKTRILFTDKDSLCYLIETENLEEDRLKEIEVYDTSNYP